MAKFTPQGVIAWLEEHAASLCTTEQLEHIRDKAGALAQDKQAEMKHRRQALEEAARKLNVTVEELVRGALGDQPMRKLKGRARKPYMNPFELEAGDESKVQIYFLADGRLPDWAKALEEPAGDWDRDEFRFDKIKKAMADNGMTCRIANPEEIYHRLVKAEEDKQMLSREQKRKKKA